MAVSAQKSIDSALEGMLGKVKPKARYISELHVDEYNDSIYKEIINGDIEIPKERQSVEKKEEKTGYEEMLRKKFLEQIEKEKEELEHKLGYISNSINSIKKYDQLKAVVRSPMSMRESYTMGVNRQNEEWREQIKVRSKELEERKKKIEEEKKKKEEEMNQMAKRLKQEQNEMKKKEIMQKMKAIQQRMKNRQEEVKSGQQRYLRVKNQKSLHEKINESYLQKQRSFLQEQKKKLAQIRSLKKPIDQNQLKEHDIKFMQLKRQKQQLRERERKMNESRSKAYKPMYESLFYKQVIQSEKNEEENPGVVKSEKMKQFAQHIKQHFAPSISERKRQEIQELIEKQKRKQEQRLEKQRQLLEKSKVKGLQYLQIIRSIPKKKKEDHKIEPPKTDRIKYHNYLTHHSDNTATKQPWTKILNSSNDKQSKAIKIQFQSERKQIQLERREQQARLLKKGDSSQIDDEYFSMIKAKLDLLKE